MVPKIGRVPLVLRRPPIRDSVPTVKIKGMSISKLGRMFKIKKYRY